MINWSLAEYSLKTSHAIFNCQMHNRGWPKFCQPLNLLLHVSPRVSNLSLATEPRPNICQTIFSNFANLLWASELYDQFPKVLPKITLVANCTTKSLPNFNASWLYLQTSFFGSWNPHRRVLKAIHSMAFDKASFFGYRTTNQRLTKGENSIFLD